MAVSASEIERIEASKKPRTQYTDEYRQECVNYYLKAKEIDPKKTLRECAKDMNLNEKTLGDWVARFSQTGKTTRSKDEYQKEREALLKRIQELEEQVAFLKKASAFFASSLA